MNNNFYRFGQWIYRRRLTTLILSCILIAGCLPVLTNLMKPFQSTDFVVKNSHSLATSEFLAQKLGYQAHPMLILYRSDTLHALEAQFIKKIEYSLKNLKGYTLQHTILYPQANQKQISKDKHTAYATVLFKDNSPMSSADLLDFKKRVRQPRHMQMWIGGDPVFIDSINKETQSDLLHADTLAAPLSILVLLLVFGSVVAACVPLLLGGGCAIIMLAALYGFAHIFSLSIFTINIALLLGLCLSLDYALFIVYRFREELRKKSNLEHAIAITMATAGRAVFFSGLAVFVSLSALMMFPVNILFSVGVGGLTATFIAVTLATTMLPACLAVLNHRINSISIRRLDHKKTSLNSGWRRLALVVVGRPIIFFISTLSLIMLISYPFLHARFGLSDEHILPDQATGRQFFTAYQASFPSSNLTPINLVIQKIDGMIVKQHNLMHLQKLINKIKKDKRVRSINSIVNLDNKLSISQYAALYSMPIKQQPVGVRKFLKTTTGKNFTLVRVYSKYDANAPETRDLIKSLRALKPGKGWDLQLTGIPIKNLEVLESIRKNFPAALIWTIGFSYLILLILLRSFFLPLKAIVMNILSLCASYGVLVFVFQDGHMHQLLNFHPQGMLDLNLLVIIFCALFGFSMDYEVFLLTRIQEHYLKTHNNNKSIVFGMIKSGRIITSAALIVICLCGSFMIADVLMVKEFGLGIAVAIGVDAFIIRTLLVPSTMVLLKKWNWCWFWFSTTYKQPLKIRHKEKV